MRRGYWGKRIKTGKTYRLPFSPAAAAILGTAEQLPLASNPRYNLLLKVVADRAGLPDDLSSHVARHTFINSLRPLRQARRITEKEYELMTGDSARVLKRHYEQADEVAMAAALCPAPLPSAAPPSAPHPLAPETWGRRADRAARFPDEEPWLG